MKGEKEINEQATLFSDNPEYDAFVEKFKPKLTTDDCYTPPEIYEAVKDWACDRFNIDPAKTVRPFYPGGDYESFDYSDGAIVLDNPPFSILSKIVDFYIAKNIPFFLFAPSLVVFGYLKSDEVSAVIIYEAITYANGATVKTAFLTNMGAAVRVETAPELDKTIKAVNTAKKAAALPKYSYPLHVLTSQMMAKYSGRGISVSASKSESALIRALDSQRAYKKAIFGKGLLLSEKAAAEKAAVVNTVTWKLSEREREIIAKLSEGDKTLDR